MQWIKDNLLTSRTFWAALVALVIGIITWIAAVPKDLAGWIALGSFVVATLGGWVAANKTQANIDAKSGGAQ